MNIYCHALIRYSFIPTLTQIVFHFIPTCFLLSRPTSQAIHSEILQNTPSLKTLLQFLKYSLKVKLKLDLHICAFLSHHPEWVWKQSADVSWGYEGVSQWEELGSAAASVCEVQENWKRDMFLSPLCTHYSQKVGEKVSCNNHKDLMSLPCFIALFERVLNNNMNKF